MKSAITWAGSEAYINSIKRKDLFVYLYITEKHKNHCTILKMFLPIKNYSHIGFILKKTIDPKSHYLSYAAKSIDDS